MSWVTVTSYVVIQCNACGELSYMRTEQKTRLCKRCGVKNDHSILKEDVTAREAKDFIISKKNKNAPSGFTWVTG